MITIYLNGNQIDIDDDTAIGVNITSVDPMKLGNIKKVSTNNFSVPKTFNNLKVFGFAGTTHESQSINKAYDRMAFEYYYYNEQVFKGYCYLDKIGERIHLVGYEFPNVFDWMRSIPYSEFIEGFLYDYLAPDFNVPTGVEYPTILSTRDELKRYMGLNTGGSTDKCDALQFILTLNDEGLDQPFYQLPDADPWVDVNISQYEELEDEDENVNKIVEAKFLNGNHYATRFKYIIDFIERFYNLENDTGETIEFIGLEDIATNTYGHFIGSNLEKESWMLLKGLGAKYSLQTERVQFINETFVDESKGYEGKTLYDVFMTFIKMFDLVLDTSVQSDNSIRYYIRDFNKLESDAIQETEQASDYRAKIINFSNNIDFSSLEFSPKFEGLSRNNYKTYAAVPDNVTENYKGFNFVCNNKNLPLNGELSKVPAFVPGETTSYPGGIKITIGDCRFDSAKSNFIIVKRTPLVPDGEPVEQPFVTYFVYKLAGYNAGLRFPFLDVVPAYGLPITLLPYRIITEGTTPLQISLLIKAFQNPQQFKIKKYLTIQDIRKIKRYNLYYIKQLAGSFLLKEISGFNPKNGKATDITLVKVSDKTSEIFDEFDYYVINGDFLTINNEKLY